MRGPRRAEMGEERCAAVRPARAVCLSHVLPCCLAPLALALARCQAHSWKGLRLRGPAIHGSIAMSRRGSVDDRGRREVFWRMLRLPRCSASQSARCRAECLCERPLVRLTLFPLSPVLPAVHPCASTARPAVFSCANLPRHCLPCRPFRTIDTIPSSSQLTAPSLAITSSIPATAIPSSPLSPSLLPFLSIRRTMISFHPARLTSSKAGPALLPASPPEPPRQEGRTGHSSPR
ncbi:hypothetical protein C8Q77DRAFT_61931 [Trametes polyzona]|nr:hypothetical protein C8Q77DRAFT_61931 [Trametes polyzona]